MASEREETQISCKFVTKMGEEYRVPGSAIAVPGRLGRYGLSEVINHLLGLDPPKPFDFLINGELLRSSLEKFLARRALTAESDLEVEYLPVVSPPKPEAQGEHKDWVAAVDGSVEGAVLTGSYDAIARVWDAQANCTCELGGHDSAINSISALPGSAGAATTRFLTASKDHTVRLWSAHIPGAAKGKKKAAGGEMVCVLKGHEDAVEAVAAHPDGSKFASGGWDKVVRVWGVPSADQVTEAQEKAAAGAPRKRKGGAGAEAVFAPSAGLEGHTQCVSSVAWEGPTRLASGSWDHSVRIWDVPSGVNVETFNGNKAVYDIAVRGAGAGGGGGVIAIASADRNVRVWDPRSGLISSEAVAVQLYSSHGGWVTSVAWHPTSEHHLASASYDGSVKLWDIRSKMPLHTIEDHGDKVLSVAWAGAGGRRLASGGADSQLRVHDVDIGM